MGGGTGSVARRQGRCFGRDANTRRRVANVGSSGASNARETASRLWSCRSCDGNPVRYGGRLGSQHPHGWYAAYSSDQTAILPWRLVTRALGTSRMWAKLWFSEAGFRRRNGLMREEGLGGTTRPRGRRVQTRFPPKATPDKQSKSVGGKKVWMAVGVIRGRSQGKPQDIQGQRG